MSGWLGVQYIKCPDQLKNVTLLWVSLCFKNAIYQYSKNKRMHPQWTLLHLVTLKTYSVQMSRSIFMPKWSTIKELNFHNCRPQRVGSTTTSKSLQSLAKEADEQLMALPSDSYRLIHDSRYVFFSISMSCTEHHYTIL